MDAIVHRISAWDGLPLVVREWRDGHARVPLLCLPGIVRTSGDFAALAQALGAGRRVVAPDYAGRGQSGRARDVMVLTLAFYALVIASYLVNSRHLVPVTDLLGILIFHSMFIVFGFAAATFSAPDC